MGRASRLSLIALLCILPPLKSIACGGFFCQIVPIDQAGEQIVFHQSGDIVTALVEIQYVGDAENFAWVVPVPGLPELDIGSDLVFSALEPATRPRFFLDQTGAGCPVTATDEDDGLNSTDGGSTPDEAGNNTGVEILETVTIGPFDIQIITSDDATALNAWLTANNFDLTDRGSELIAPYVAEGMNFVTLKLAQSQGVGDIQPLIMRYQSERPMIPIRLTAVAATPDMGITAWFLGNHRAVPLNYLHVTPNYALLNWYTGTNNAYASYQSLITAAMDEAGGQGFATDYAGTDFSFLNQIPTSAQLSATLTTLDTADDDALFVANLLQSGNPFPQSKSLEILRRALPLETGENETIYSSPSQLNERFDDETLAAARIHIIEELTNTVIEPLGVSLAVFDGASYLSRLYTTLSPEEMTLDPVFAFNAEVDDQPLDRWATMHRRCESDTDFWTLTLGPGTGRNGEQVIDAEGTPPGFTAPLLNPAELNEQLAVWRAVQMTENGEGEEVINNGNKPAASNSGGGSGAMDLYSLLWLLSMLAATGFYTVMKEHVHTRSV